MHEGFPTYNEETGGAKPNREAYVDPLVRPPLAMGHTFRDDLVCKCGLHFDEHRAKPEECGEQRGGPGYQTIRVKTPMNIQRYKMGLTVSDICMGIGWVKSRVEDALYEHKARIYRPKDAPELQAWLDSREEQDEIQTRNA